MPSLSVSLLGGFHVELDNNPVTDFESDKVRALLAYLVVESGRAHARSALAALLWPDHTEEAARTNLRHVLHQLRRTLREKEAPQPFLLATRNTIQFNPEAAYTLDVDLFQEQLTLNEQCNHAEWAACPACVSRCQQAASLYRGDFLAGFAVPDSDLFEEWVVVQREQLHRQALDLFFELANYYEQRREFEQARQCAWRQIEMEPWREEAHRQLMRILARSGQRSAALAQYEACRVILERELGVAPAAETVALHAQIRAGKLDATVAEPAADAPSAPAPRQDWGGAPMVAYFYGRHAELEALHQWVMDEQCRLVMVLGMGGMGKTTLVTKVAHSLAEHFDAVFWRSLLNAPPPAEFLRECLQFLSPQPLTQPPDTLGAQLSLLFDQLRQQRCLLVLDNMESVLEAGQAGQYRAGYEAYGQLLERMGHATHQSCLILTSRERPQNVERLEENPYIRSLPLTGLGEQAGQALLKTRGLIDVAELSANVVQRYSGNPLALKLIARTIQELFDGDIASFLSDEVPIFDDIRAVLDQQFARLSPLERGLIYWLAIEREPVLYADLAHNLIEVRSRATLIEALRSLQRRSLLVRSDEGFTLQNVVTEYATEHLIAQVTREIAGESDDAHEGPALSLHYLNRYALLKAQSKEYIRQSQVRLILAPIAEQAAAQLGPAGLDTRLRQILDYLRSAASLPAGYAGGNILNLLVYLQWNAGGYDFSHLNIRQAYLRGATLPGLQLQGANLVDSVFTDTFGMINALDFSSSGQFVAGGTGEGDVRLWRVSDGSPAGLFTNHAAAVWSVAFSPDGALLASCGDEPTVYVCHADTGQRHALLTGGTTGFNAIAFSPDGRRLAGAGYDGRVYLWTIHPDVHQVTPAAEPTQPAHILTGHADTLYAVAFSPDGMLLATGGNDRTVRLWDLQSGETRHILRGHAQRVYAIAFSPGGSQLASGSVDKTIAVWDVAQGRLRRTLDGHADVVRSVAYSPDGETLASGSYDESVRLWDPKTGETRGILTGHQGWVRAVAYSPDGKTLASGSFDYTVRLWDIQRQAGQPRHTLQGYADVTRTLAFSPDGKTLACGGDDRTIRLRDVDACLAADGHADAYQQLRGHTKVVRAVAYSPDGKMLASGSFDQTVRLWNLQQPIREAAHVLRAHTNWVRAIAFSSDGARLVSGSWDQTICIWDVHRGHLLHQIHGHSGHIWSVAFSPDGKILASGGADQALRLWDAHSGKLIAQLEGHEDTVKSVAFSPNGEWIASGGDDRTIRLWGVESAQSPHPRARVLPGHTDVIWAIAFSPDGRLLASGSADQTIRLWRLSSPHGPDEPDPVYQVLRGHTNWVWSTAFSPDGRLLASCSPDQTVKLWDVQTGNCMRTLRDQGPYLNMNIRGATGISEAQRTALKALGAVEQ